MILIHTCPIPQADSSILKTSSDSQPSVVVSDEANAVDHKRKKPRTDLPPAAAAYSEDVRRPPAAPGGSEAASSRASLEEDNRCLLNFSEYTKLDYGHVLEFVCIFIQKPQCVRPQDTLLASKSINKSQLLFKLCRTTQPETRSPWPVCLVRFGLGHS